MTPDVAWGKHIGCLKLNPGQLHARQMSHALYYHDSLAGDIFCNLGDEPGAEKQQNSFETVFQVLFGL